jgi:hypothetical protein
VIDSRASPLLSVSTGAVTAVHPAPELRSTHTERPLATGWTAASTSTGSPTCHGPDGTSLITTVGCLRTFRVSASVAFLARRCGSATARTFVRPAEPNLSRTVA